MAGLAVTAVAAEVHWEEVQMERRIGQMSLADRETHYLARFLEKANKQYGCGYILTQDTRSEEGFPDFWCEDKTLGRTLTVEIKEPRAHNAGLIEDVEKILECVDVGLRPTLDKRILLVCKDCNRTEVPTDSGFIHRLCQRVVKESQTLKPQGNEFQYNGLQLFLCEAPEDWSTITTSCWIYRDWGGGPTFAQVDLEARTIKSMNYPRRSPTIALRLDDAEKKFVRQSQSGEYADSNAVCFCVPMQRWTHWFDEGVAGLKNKWILETGSQYFPGSEVHAVFLVHGNGDFRDYSAKLLDRKARSIVAGKV